MKNSPEIKRSLIDNWSSGALNEESPKVQKVGILEYSGVLKC
jgi:hypothetical protein